MSLNKLCSSQSGFVEPLQVFNWLGYFHHHLEVCSLCIPPTFFSSCCLSNILLDICITNFMNSLSESSKNKPTPRKIWFANVITLVKMYSPNIYKPSRDDVAYHHSSQAVNRLHSSQNLYRNPLQVFNRLCSCQIVLTEHLQAFNRLCGDQKCMMTLHRYSNRLRGTQN